MPVLRSRLTFANVVSMLALFIALATGGAYAASQVGSSEIAKNAIKSKHVKDGAILSEDVGNGTLVGADFAQGTLLRGPAGETGPAGGKGDQGIQGIQGIQGVKGDTGAVIVARARGNTAVLTPDTGTANYPLTGASWSQPADALELGFGEITVTPPATCSAGSFGAFTHQFAINGTPVGTPTQAQVQLAGGGARTLPLVFPTSLDPGS